MANNQRLRRMADVIQRELSALLLTEVKDPRIGLITITDVDVSPDLAHAKVFYTTMAEGEARDHTRDGLKRAAGFLRTELGHRMSTHAVPELRFMFDDSVERGARLSQLIDEAMTPRKPPED